MQVLTGYLINYCILFVANCLRLSIEFVQKLKKKKMQPSRDVNIIHTFIETN